MKHQQETAQRHRLHGRGLVGNGGADQSAEGRHAERVENGGHDETAWGRPAKSSPK